MKYQPPFGASDPDASYANVIPGVRRGSQVPAEAVEHPQREILAVINAAGIDPASDDLTQLLQAINSLVTVSINVALEENSVYELGEFYFFRHPTVRPGFQPCHGGLLPAAADLYPQIWEYLQTTVGRLLCKSEADWQAMTRAIWHTNADGTTVGWNGIGGAPFFAPNYNTGALRLPDIRGMYAEAAGFDSLGVGEVHGDGIRAETGSFTYSYAQINGFKGGFAGSNQSYTNAVGSSNSSNPLRTVTYDNSRVTPVADKVAPRAFGVLTCVYLGKAAS